jgi:hypothetical protein
MTTTPIHLVPISAFIQYSARLVPMLCSSGTNVVLVRYQHQQPSRPVLDIVQNFGMLLEENRGHGFCPERRLHVENESEFTHITRVDLHLRGNDSAKISKNLKLPTCTSIFVQMVSDLEILRYGFCLECGKLSKCENFSKIRIVLEDMGGSLTRICPN